MNRFIASLTGCVMTLAAGTALQAAPVTYNIDSNHTYPSFEADHGGGMSLWRGKFTRTSGKIVLDRDAKSGTLEVSIDTASVDVGHERLETRLRGADFFDVEKFPTATYTGKFSRFDGANPTEVQGELTLHGVTRPVTLTITQFLCKTDARNNKESCGADATATINRKDFGIGFGEQVGVKMPVKLLISIEAAKSET